VYANSSNAAWQHVASSAPPGLQDRRQELEALLREEPLVRRERRRPVDVGLRVPLPALPALVQAPQLLDLAAVVPRPVQVDRHVDVELAPEVRDAVLVDVHHLEVAEVPPILRQDLVHDRPLLERMR
jgi:hypothetical protein